MRIPYRFAGETRIAPPMTPMIDVVFQLLVFFLFTFKIIPIEGEFGVNMPPITSGAQPQSDSVILIEKLRIGLRATPEGALNDIVLGENQLGADIPVLTQYLREFFVGPTGHADDVEVEIDADRQLRYHYVIRVISAVKRAGIRKINFTDPLAQEKER